MYFYRLFLIFNITFLSCALQASSFEEDHEIALRHEQVHYEHRRGVWEKVELLPNLEWHRAQAKNIIRIQSHIQQFYEKHPSSKHPNIATFMIQVNYDFLDHFSYNESSDSESENHIIRGMPIKGTKDSSQDTEACLVNIYWPPSFFISGGFKNGGNQELQDYLNTTLSPDRFLSVRDYCPQEEDQPLDQALRKRITQLFKFESFINSKMKQGLREKLAQQFAKLKFDGGDFTIQVTPRSVEAMVEKSIHVLEHNLFSRAFTEESDIKAKQMGLFNKLKKDQPLGHINELFDETFSLQFGDSEQAIMMFYAKEFKKPNPIEGYDLMMEALYRSFFSFLKVKENFDLEEEIKTFPAPKNGEKKAQQDFLKIYDSLIWDKKMVESLLYFIIPRLSVHFHLVSYYDVCRNCRASFDQEIVGNGFIHKNIIGEIIGDFFKNFLPSKIEGISAIGKNMLNTSFNKKVTQPASPLFINTFLVLEPAARTYLHISSLVNYEEQDED